MVDKRLILRKLTDLGDLRNQIDEFRCLSTRQYADFDGFKSAIADFIEPESQGGRRKSGKKKQTRKDEG